jgi:hypothetical protein
MNKPEMAVALRQGVCKVEFTKADGSNRVMMATLDSNEIPASPQNTGTGTRTKRAPNPNLMVVYDVEAKGWRSFKVDSVIGFDILELV